MVTESDTKSTLEQTTSVNKTMMTKYFKVPALDDAKSKQLLNQLQLVTPSPLISLETEICFYIGHDGELSQKDKEVLNWLISETFSPQDTSIDSFLNQKLQTNENIMRLECGPRLTFSTAWSSNAVSICHNSGLGKVKRFEYSVVYFFQFSGSFSEKTIIDAFSPYLYDRMTQCVYIKPLETFGLLTEATPWEEVDILGRGKVAIKELDEQLGLGFDEQDIEMYIQLFEHDLKRNPTTVELYDLAQSNSEHSRHWFFGANLVIDGEKQPHTLFELVKKPYKINPKNSVLAFCDNASALRGRTVKMFHPDHTHTDPSKPYSIHTKDMDVTFTAETHNFPCGVAPFPGAETGVGGRIRDGHAAGRGSLVCAGTAGYCVGNLNIPNHNIWGEASDWCYPERLAKPLDILLRASDGACDYSNKFGEPLVCGFCRSFGMILPNNERREWIKPIMFVGGIGLIEHTHLHKQQPDIGMPIIKIGGPAYRIGMGGGAASSLIAGDNSTSLDFNAVQRGDAKMLQCVNRVVRMCVEMGRDNPIISIHDQGAGGSANVLKELVYPQGGLIDVRKMLSGDPSLSVLELWGAEYQENDALLISPEKEEDLIRMCAREKCPMCIVGHVTGDKNIVVYDSHTHTKPVDLPLEKILGKLPPKTFYDVRLPNQLNELVIPKDISLLEHLENVCKLVSIGSKRFLVHKGDRSVTGLVVQQQCVGPLETPVADYALIAHSFFGCTGSATAIGEQPIKGFISQKKMARLCVCEALTNIIFANIENLSEIKLSGNWMWPAKLKGEATHILEAATALSDLLIELEIAIDGGKDSLSMAAHIPQTDELVKCPGELTLSAYAQTHNFDLAITPELKSPGQSQLILISLGDTHTHTHLPLGGSALAQIYKQIGSDCPDIDAHKIKKIWPIFHTFLQKCYFLAGHDVSEGGLIVSAIEMAMGGHCGVTLCLDENDTHILNKLFCEVPGLLVEVANNNVLMIQTEFEKYDICVDLIGYTHTEQQFEVINGQETLLKTSLSNIRNMWESTSYEIEKLQRNMCEVESEYKGMCKRTKGPQHKITFEYNDSHTHSQFDTNIKTSLHTHTPHISKPKVAILREEGSNGDREMAAAFHRVGFDVWDVTMSDLLSKHTHISKFQGVVFVGGFSYGDTLDSSKGWASTILFNAHIRQQFDEFYTHPHTFSLGVCNGCQLMSLLGWIPGQTRMESHIQPRFIKNKSGKFESRFSTVKILESRSIFFKEMEGSTLGVWVAHCEGQAHFPHTHTQNLLFENKQIPAVYVDDQNEATEVYPFNPNGSPMGVVGLCSQNGQHMGFMPHPERCFMGWQWPYLSTHIKEMCTHTNGLSPWIKMFQNAYNWCLEHPF